jgi:integrase
LWLFCRLIYSTFIRPGELLRLKVGDIDFEGLFITIDGDIAKNHKTQTVDLSDDLAKELKEFVKNSQKTNFLFRNKAGNKVHDNTFRERFMKHRRRLRLNDQYTVYAFKHTGVIHHYLKFKDVYAIKEKCRHADIKETDNYLRDLGVLRRKRIEVLEL